MPTGFNLRSGSKSLRAISPPPPQLIIQQNIARS